MLKSRIFAKYRIPGDLMQYSHWPACAGGIAECGRCRPQYDHQPLRKSKSIDVFEIFMVVKK
jgi:hypothetical protein